MSSLYSFFASKPVSTSRSTTKSFFFWRFREIQYSCKSASDAWWKNSRIATSNPEQISEKNGSGQFQNGSGQLVLVLTFISGLIWNGIKNNVRIIEWINFATFNSCVHFTSWSTPSECTTASKFLWKATTSSSTWLTIPKSSGNMTLYRALVWAWLTIWC